MNKLIIIGTLILFSLSCKKASHFYINTDCKSFEDYKLVISTTTIDGGKLIDDDSALFTAVLMDKDGVKIPSTIKWKFHNGNVLDGDSVLIPKLDANVSGTCDVEATQAGGFCTKKQTVKLEGHKIPTCLSKSQRIDGGFGGLIDSSSISYNSNNIYTIYAHSKWGRSEIWLTLKEGLPYRNNRVYNLTDEAKLRNDVELKLVYKPSFGGALVFKPLMSYPGMTFPPDYNLFCYRDAQDSLNFILCNSKLTDKKDTYEFELWLKAK